MVVISVLVVVPVIEDGSLVEVSIAEVLVFENLVNWPNALEAQAKRRPEDKRMTKE